MPVQPTAPSPQDRIEDWWRKLIVSLELADLADPATRDRLDSAAAKANNQGLRAAGWQYAAAIPLLTAAVEIWARLDHVPGEVSARNVRGAVYRKLGDLPSALDDHESALARARDAGHGAALTGGLIAALAGIGAAQIEQDQPDAALAPLDEALTLADDAQDAGSAARVRGVMGRAHEERKQWDAALGAYGAAVEGWRALSAPVEEIEATAGVARVLLAQGQTVSASALVEQLLRHLGDHGPARLDDPLRLYWTIYRVLYAVRQEDNAREMLRAAHDMMQRQAAGLADDARQRFLDTTLNRAIIKAWQG